MRGFNMVVLNRVMKTQNTEQPPQMLLVALPEEGNVPECLALKMIRPTRGTTPDGIPFTDLHDCKKC